MNKLIIGLAKVLCKWFNKRHFIPFIENLVAIGRPGPVVFPIELIDQGIELLLSGLNNTISFHSNRGWVWAWWYEQQQNPTNQNFIPTGMSMLTANLTHRNWTSIGVWENNKEVMVDPVGMLTPRPYSFSLMPYAIFDDKYFYPSREGSKISQSNTYPIGGVQTQYQASPELEWNLECIPWSKKNQFCIVQRMTFINHSTKEKSFKTGMAIRPYNCMSIGHIHKIKFIENHWKINNKTELICAKTPDQIYIGDRHSGDPLMGKGHQDKLELKSNTGILAAQVEYKIHLKPGEKKTLEFYSPITKKSKLKRNILENLDANIEPLDWSAQLDKWQSIEDRAMKINCPDESINVMYKTLVMRLANFYDQTHFSPGTWQYHQHWFRDSAFISLAFDQIGLSQEVLNTIPLYAKKQDTKGFFRSQNGEWDSNGQAIWSLVQHSRRTSNLELIDHNYKSLIKGAQWIDKMCSSTSSQHNDHAGLLPAGFSAEHFGPNDHYYWDNFWSVGGLKELLWVTENVNNQHRDYLESLYHRLSENLINNTNRAAEKHNGILPPSPYRHPDAACIGNLVAISPLNLQKENTLWAQKTTDWVYKHCLKDKMFFQSIIHTGKNPYLSIQLARAIKKYDLEKANEIYKSVLTHASSTLSWPEAIHPQSNGGCMGDGDHGWAIAEVLNYTRDQFIDDTQNQITLIPYIKKEWRLAGKSISIANAPTLYGKISFKINFFEDHLFYDIKTKSSQKLCIDLGQSTKDSIVKLNNKSGTLYYSSPLNENHLEEKLYENTI